MPARPAPNVKLLAIWIKWDSAQFVCPAEATHIGTQESRYNAIPTIKQMPAQAGYTRARMVATAKNVRPSPKLNSFTRTPETGPRIN